ncbi:hypothetical protein D6C77_04047 [Aureobasidium pullulans]|nr:hypothetical protein D6C77_04047 [Aureobasidium pullulans]
MSSRPVPFSVANVTTWTYQGLKSHAENARSRKPKYYFVNFFGWSAEEYVEAKEYTVAELDKQPFDVEAAFPTAGPKAKLRHVIQKKLIADRPDLFVDRHGRNPPAWFLPEMISSDPKADQPYHNKNVTQQFIAVMNSHRKAQKRNNSRYNEDDEQEEEDDTIDENSRQSRNKRQRTSTTERSTTFPVLASMSMAPSPSTTAPSSMASELRKPPGRFSTLSSDGTGSRQAVTVRRPNRSSGMILYITRVTIDNQHLILERHRYGLVSRLFEEDRLVEARLQELVFGNPIHDKPTSLWFFDNTTNEQLRSITNRPSAEAAIDMLRVYGEQSGATGIQLFDAPDRQTAALVPSHEANRQNDFGEHESYELEIDNEDDGEDGSPEQAIRVDSAYDSRDGGNLQEEELELDAEALEGEVDLSPKIKREEGEHQQQQKVSSESESESDEDGDVKLFYR